MQAFRLVLVLLSLLILAKPVTAQRKGERCSYLSAPQVMNGVLWPVQTMLCRDEIRPPKPFIHQINGTDFRIVLYQHGLFLGYPLQEMNIEGASFARESEVKLRFDSVENKFYPATGTLNKEYSFAGISYPKGTWLMWSRGVPSVARFPHRTKIAGIKLKEKTDITLDSKGRLESLVLAEDSVISGIPCVAYAKDSPGFHGQFLPDVLLYGNGSVAQCRLSQSHPISHKLYPAGTELDFYPNGNLRSFLLPEPRLDSYTEPIASVLTVQEIACAMSPRPLESIYWLDQMPKEEIDSFLNKLPWVVPTHELLPRDPKDDKLGWFSVPKRFDLLLYPNGQLAACRLRDTATMDGMTITQSERFQATLFYPSGKIRKALLARPYRHHHKMIPAGSVIEFQENGSIKTIKKLISHSN